MGQKERHFKVKEKVFGQFFTPPEVADFIVSLASSHLSEKEAACDPACGDGVFLRSLIKLGFKEIVGMDVDKTQLQNISKTTVEENVKLVAGDALQRAITLQEECPPLPEGYFNLVVGNPPFSAKYGRVKDKVRLSLYKLGSKLPSQAIEVLFLERFLQLAKIGGVIGIILPDGIFLNLNYRPIRRFILGNCQVLAVISLPRAIFEGSKSTTSKTSVLVAVKGTRHEGKVFMAEANSVSELTRVLELYRTRKSDRATSWVEPASESLHPKTYLKAKLPRFKLPTFKLKELITDMHGGSTEYGKARQFSASGLRYLSAKVVTPLGIDFARDERKFIEPNSPMDKEKAHVTIGDVLFVRVGVGCIGRAAVVVDENDLGVADDWIYIIRVKRELISPCYLALFIQSKYGKSQVELHRREVGTATIPQSLMKEILVPVPPMRFQEEIEKRYIKMVEARRNGSYEKAEELYRALVGRVEEQVSGATSG